jgi:hypothetical protein
MEIPADLVQLVEKLAVGLEPNSLLKTKELFSELSPSQTNNDTKRAAKVTALLQP